MQDSRSRLNKEQTAAAPCPIPSPSHSSQSQRAQFGSLTEPDEEQAADPSCPTSPPPDSEKPLSEQARLVLLTEPDEEQVAASPCPTSSPPYSSQLLSEQARPSSPTETNEEQTAALWVKVREQCFEGMAPATRSSKAETESKSKSQTGTNRSAITKSTGSKSRKTQSVITGSGKSKSLPKIKSKDFRPQVMEPRRIRLSSPQREDDPFIHFGTQDPETTEYRDIVPEWYQRQWKYSHVWHSLDRTKAADEAQEYRELIAGRENEAKYSDNTKSYFFKSDKLSNVGLPDRVRKTLSKSLWGPNPGGPGGAVLKCPPPVQPVPDTALSPFDRNPDLTYWLRVESFHPSYRSALPFFVCIDSSGKGTCPYMTVEFKKDRDTTLQEAENQLAISSALVVYNRFLLRCQQLRESGQKPLKEWDKAKFNGIKHYGFVFHEFRATLYIVRPALEFPPLVGDADSSCWRGCDIVPLERFDATVTDSILALKKWMNEIHNWGLGEYCDDIVSDLEALQPAAKRDRDRDGPNRSH
ncbi:MAG: hypothetical protein Q9162_007413 [Coniocarpon cinnabarinum]